MSVGQPFTDLWNKIKDTGPRWLVALAIVVFTYLVARLMGKLVQKAIGRTSTQGHVDILIGRAVSALILLLGAILALSEVGMSLSAALATLGLASVGIGFALQDILANLFAGVILLVQHPFTIGDQVRVGDQEGTVENVRVRDTQILTYDGMRVFIPNKTVFSSPIINYSSTPSLRTDLRFSLRYARDIEKARAAALGILAESPGVQQQPTPLVLVESEEKHVSLVLRFWRDSDRNRGLRLGSDVTERLLTRLTAEGIDYLHEESPEGPPEPPAAPGEGETGVMPTL